MKNVNSRHPRSRRIEAAMFVTIAAAGLIWEGGVSIAAPMSHLSSELVSDDNNLLIGDLGEAVENLSADPLLVVGPVVIDSANDGGRLTVLGLPVSVTPKSTFPRGAVATGDYVAIFGRYEDDGQPVALTVVQLGGAYVQGTSPVYIRGTAAALDEIGLSTIGGKQISLANALYNQDLVGLPQGTAIEVVGFEAGFGSSSLLVATSASVLQGINGSGVKGINGSGIKGINGSGIKGLNGRDVKSINGS